MRKTFLLIACLFTGIYLHGQVAENGFVIRLNGNYNETAAGNILKYINSYDVKSKDGNMSVSAGYMYRHWLFGLGFEYNRNKSEAQGGLYERFYYYDESYTPENPASKIRYFVESSEFKLNSYGGIFYVSRYLPIYRNLYFTPGFYLGYGTINGNQSGTMASISTEDYPPLTFHPYYRDTYITSFEEDISLPYFYMQVSPELTWFLSNRLGLNVQMGGLGINVIDSDWRNSSKQINFNPSYWKLGIFFKI